MLTHVIISIVSIPAKRDMQVAGVLLVALLGFTAAQERGPDGFIRLNGGCGTRPGGKVCSMETIGYPKQLPANVKQTWSFLSAGDHMQTALKIKCTDVSTPKGEPCGDYVFKFMEGREEKQWCGNVGSLTFITKKDYVRFAFNSGPEGGGKLKCEVWGVQVDKDGKEMPLAPKPVKVTTPAPIEPPGKSRLPQFLLTGSLERDSTEYGVAPGKTQTSCKCGWANKAFSRIVAGDFAKENEFPWIVAITEKGSDFNFCGGSIISPWHALTAAHCTDDAVKEGVTLSIIAGGHNIRRPIAGVTQVIDVEKIIQHKQYLPGVWKNDISLLVLKDQVKFSDLVGPVCLPTQPMAKQLGTNRDYVKIIGWGAIFAGGPSSPILKKVDVRVVPPTECTFMYKIYDSENPTQICTYARSRASCQGDSGGPVVWVDPATNRYTLVGLVSFGRVCADISPSVHTDIGYYLPWINSNIAANKKTDICSKV